jgi:GTP-binding protein HflX
LDLPDNISMLLTDTVGFIRKLPHHLIKAFHSTLEEASYADILLVLVDATDPEGEEHLAVTEELLRDLGAGGKPVLYVFNKCDAVDTPLPPRGAKENTVYISAKTGEGVEDMLNTLVRMIQNGKRLVELRFPYSEQGRMSAVYNYGNVEDVSYLDDTISVRVVLDDHGIGFFRNYLADKSLLRREDEDV